MSTEEIPDFHTPQGEDVPLWGTVMAVQANFYQVRLRESSPMVGGNLLPVSSLLCTRRTRLKKIGQQVMVGDRVLIEKPDWMGGRGAIAQVLPRETQLDRPPIANVNQILLLFALAEPDLDAMALSRFLVKAESTGLQVSLVLNKCDLVSQKERDFWEERLKKWGYHPIFISIETSVGLEEDGALYECLRDKITVISGPSGVGKSSLINDLIPELKLRVGSVSGKLNRGRHTTRHVELFELPMGGLLADTPGFNQPALECSPQELAYYFPEARHHLSVQYCQFNDCLHRDEPNCIVRGNWERYSHYLDWLEETVRYQEALQQIRDPESTLKLKSKKSKTSGQEFYEPKLESKKYRRSSRRLQNQSLSELYEDHQHHWDS